MLLLSLSLFLSLVSLQQFGVILSSPRHPPPPALSGNERKWAEVEKSNLKTLIFRLLLENILYVTATQRRIVEIYFASILLYKVYSIQHPSVYNIQYPSVFELYLALDC